MRFKTTHNEQNKLVIVDSETGEHLKAEALCALLNNGERNKRKVEEAKHILLDGGDDALYDALCALQGSSS